MWSSKLENWRSKVRITVQVPILVHFPIPVQESKIVIFQGVNYEFVFTYQSDFKKINWIQLTSLPWLRKETVVFAGDCSEQNKKKYQCYTNNWIINSLLDEFSCYSLQYYLYHCPESTGTVFLVLKVTSVAYSSQGSYTDQLDFCNWLAVGSITG